MTDERITAYLLEELTEQESEQFEDARGETKPTAHLPHVDEASQLRRAAHLKQLLDQLNAIPPQQLSAAEQVNAAVFRTILENGIGEARFRQWEMPFNSDSSFWTYLDENHQLRDAAEYQRPAGLAAPRGAYREDEHDDTDEHSAGVDDAGDERRNVEREPRRSTSRLE